MILNELLPAYYIPKLMHLSALSFMEASIWGGCQVTKWPITGHADLRTTSGLPGNGTYTHLLFLYGSEITVERWWERMRARGFRWLKGNSVSRTQQHSCTNEVTGNVKAYSSPALSQAKQFPAWTRQLGMKSHPSQGAIDKFFASGRVRVIVL